MARTYLLLLLTTLSWGGTAVAGKLALQDIPPLTLGVIRYGGAALLLAAISRPTLAADVRPFPWGEVRPLLGLGLLGACLNHILFFVGLLFAPATHGAIIPPTTSPVWILLLAARLGGERATRGQVAGMLLCMGGVVLVMRPERLVVDAGARVFLGDLLLLLCGVSWGAYSYFSKVGMRRLAPVTALVFTLGFGTLFLLPLALVERPWHALRAASPTAWAAVGYLTVAATVFAFWGWSVAIRRLGAGRTGVFGNLIPVFGVVLAQLVLGERLTAIQLLGGLLAVAGVLVCQGRFTRTDRAPRD